MQPLHFLCNAGNFLVRAKKIITQRHHYLCTTWLAPRKRGRLERLLSEPIPERDEPHCDSPANSTASELLPACAGASCVRFDALGTLVYAVPFAVRVFERSPHGVPVITTGPSRSVSRLSSVSSVTPSTPTAMLETLSTYNNFNSTPQGFLR